MRNSEIRLHVRAQGKQSPTIPLNAVSLLLGSSDWTLLTSFIDTISTPSCREPLYFRSRRLGSVPVLNVGRAAVAIGSPRAHRVFIKTVEISTEVHKPRWSTTEMPRSSQMVYGSLLGGPI